MQDIRRNDLHHDGVADTVGHAHGFVFTGREFGSSDRQVIGCKNLLGFHFGEGSAAFGTGRGDDLAGFLPVYILGIVRAALAVFFNAGFFAQRAEGLHGQVWGVVAGNALFNDPAHGFIRAFTAYEGYGDRFAGYARIDDGFVDRLGDIHRLGDGCFAVEHSEAIHPGVSVGELGAGVVPFVAALSGDIDRVFGGAKFGHMFFELLLHIFGGEAQGDAGTFSSIGCQNANTAAIGDHQQVIAAHRRLQAKCQGTVEEIVKVRGLRNPGLFESGFVDLGGTGQRAGVRSRSSRAMGGHAGF